MECIVSMQNSWEDAKSKSVITTKLLQLGSVLLYSNKSDWEEMCRMFHFTSVEVSQLVRSLSTTLLEEFFCKANCKVSAELADADP